MSEPLFDLTLTEEQAMMRETVRRFVDSEIKEKSRAADEAASAPEGLYERSLELGLGAVQIPEGLGGFGADRSPISNMLVAEDLGAGDMSMGLGILSTLSVINTLLDQATDEQKKTWLPRFTGEEFVPAAVALMEPGVQFNPSKLATKATRSGSGYKLNGEKTMVALGGSAKLTLVIAEVEGEGPSAFVVESGQAGVTSEREEYMGLRSLELSKVSLKDVEVPESARVGGDKPFDLERLIDLGKIGLSALAVGTCQSVLEYVKEYCNERIAFGEPITNRQSVAFMIADIAIELEGMRLLTYRAASRAEQGLNFHKEAYLAHLQAAEKGMKIGTDGVQLLGGHGFIREHPVELWYRNLRAVGILSGCPAV